MVVKGRRKPRVTDTVPLFTNIYKLEKPILPTTGTMGIALAVLTILGGTVVAIKKRK